MLCFRSHARRLIAIFSFVSRLYNLPNEEMDSIEAEMNENGVTLEALHKTFYAEFMQCMCRL